MALTYIANATGRSGVGASTVDTSSSLNVQAGDILIATVQYDGTGQTGLTITDSDGSTNAFIV